MNDLLPVLEKFRVYAGMVLQSCFSSWVLMIPFAFLAVDEIGKLLRKIRP